MFQKRSERFSVESVRRSLEVGRPSEALKAIVYLDNRSWIPDPNDRIHENPRYVLDDSPEGKIRQAQRKEIHSLVRDYEKETGASLLGNERFLSTRALRLRLRGM